MADRFYHNRQIITTSDQDWKDIAESKGMGNVRLHETPELAYPKPSDIARLTLRAVTWGPNMSYTGLAKQFYGDVVWWRVIAWYNKKPTEGLCTLGDTIYVPLPLESALELLGV